MFLSAKSGNLTSSPSPDIVPLIHCAPATQAFLSLKSTKLIPTLRAFMLAFPLAGTFLFQVFTQLVPYHLDRSGGGVSLPLEQTVIYAPYSHFQRKQLPPIPEPYGSSVLKIRLRLSAPLCWHQIPLFQLPQLYCCSCRSCSLAFWTCAF